MIHQAFLSVVLLGLPLIAVADFDACVKSVPLDREVVPELPPSWFRDNAGGVLGVRGYRTDLVSSTCWRDTRGPEEQFEQTGYVTVYLPAVPVGGMCLADTENYEYVSGRWSLAREQQSRPLFGATLRPKGGCNSVRADQLVDVYQLIEEFSLESLLRAEPNIYRQYRASEADPHDRKPLRAVTVEAHDNRIFFALDYTLDSCTSYQLYVVGSANQGLQYVRYSTTMC